jgi:hypothetical protein
MITINGKSRKTSRPSDLNDRLIVSTGHGAGEIEALLSSGPDRMARAVLPFLSEDTPAVGELARDIANDRGAAEAIRALYATVPPEVAAPPAPPPTKGGDK